MVDRSLCKRRGPVHDVENMSKRKKVSRVGVGIKRRQRAGCGMVSLQISDVGARNCDSQVKSAREHQAAA